VIPGVQVGNNVQWDNQIIGVVEEVGPQSLLIRHGGDLYQITYPKPGVAWLLIERL
jgi:hypothetical protein